MPLSLPAEVAHRRLTDAFFASGQGPVSSGALARELARIPAESWAGVVKELHAIGWCVRAGRWFHPEPARLLAEGRTIQRERSAAGRAGGVSRWARARSRRPSARPSAAGSGTAAKSSQPHSTRMANASQTHPIALAKPCTLTETLRNDTVPITVNPAERSTLSVSARKKSTAAEDRFLKAVAEQFERFGSKAAPQELQNWGGWWRNRFREDPDKAQRVLADVGSMIKEGTVHTNPGAAAMDLWRRLP